MFSSEDVSNWTNEQLIEFADGIQGVDENFLEFLKTADTSGDLMEQYQQHLQNATSSTSKFSSALKSFGANLAINAGITLAISLIAKLATSYSEMIKNAQEATKTYKEHSQQLNDYKSEIESLRNIMSDHTSTSNEIADAQSRLYEIQSSLIEQYGVQANGIDLVNGLLTNQLKLLDKLNEKEIQNWANNVNKKSFGDKAYNVLGNVGDLLAAPFDKDRQLFKWEDYAAESFGTNLDKIADNVENFKKSFDVTDSEYLNSIIEDFDNISRDGDKFTIFGDVQSVSDTIATIQSQLKGIDGYNDQLDSKLTDIFNKAKSISEENLEIYNTDTQNKILQDETLSDYFVNLSKYYQDFEDAMTSGDEEVKQQSIDNYSTLMDEIINSGISERYVEYFKSLYPDIQNEIDSWNFETSISVDLENAKKIDTTSISNILKTKNGKYGVVIDPTYPDGTPIEKEQLDEWIEKASKGDPVPIPVEFVDDMGQAFSLIGIDSFDLSSDLLELEGMSADEISANLSKLDLGLTKGISDAQAVALRDIRKQAQDAGYSLDEFLQKLLELGYIKDKTLDFAPIVKNPNSSYDVKQNRESENKLNWYNTLPNDIKSAIDSGEIDLTFTDNLDDMQEKVENWKNDIENNPIQISTAINTTDAATKLKSEFGKLTDALADYTQNGFQKMDVSKLSAMARTSDDDTTSIEAVGGTEAYENFLTVMNDITSTSEEVQNAFDNLASSYIYNSELAQQITQDNEDWVASELKKNGVVNASAVAEQMLYNKIIQSGNAQEAENMAVKEAVNAHLSLGNTKLDASNASDKLKNASTSDMIALINEANAAGSNTAALRGMLSTKIAANGITLATNGDIAALSSLCTWLGIATNDLQNYARAKSAIGTNTKGGAQTALHEMNKGITANKENQIKNALANTTVNTSGGSYSNSGGGGGGKSNKSESKTLIDWIERRINVLTTKAERWAKIIENATDSKRLDSYYKKLEANYKKQVKTYSSGAARYLQKANSIKLDASLKNKVKSKDSSIFNKNGSMKSYKTLIKKYGEATAKKIQDYQNYIDKYESAIDGFIEATQKLYQSPIEKAADKIELLSDSLDLLDAKLDNISVDDYKKANDNLKEQAENAKKQLEANQEASDTAKKNYGSTKSAVTKKNNLETNDLTGNKKAREASKKAIKNAIKKGKEIDLTLYKEGSSGYKAAVKYNAALKAQKDATDALALSQEEYTKTIRENAKAQFDNVQAYYEAQIGLIDHDFTSIDNKISEIETAGKNVHKSYYESQKNLNENKKKWYEEEKANLEEQIADITQGTEEWYDAKDAIQECANNISDCVKETYELNNAINQLHFDMFQDIADGIDRVITEQEFLQGLFAHEKVTDDKTGTFTNAGIAKLGSLSASYYASKEKANNDAEELQELKDILNKGVSSDGTYGTFNSLDDLQDRINEVYTTWQDDIKDTYSLESDISELMKEKYQAELDMLQELINSKKDALNAEKDLHDYQQSIQEKTKDINTIKKQIAAYQGNSSQEGMAKLQKLQADLDDKQKDLQETEYERYIQDQQDILDNLADEYEELITKKLDNFMALVQEGLNKAGENTSIISSYLSKVASDNGYTEETKGLFTSVSGSISESTAKIISAIENRVVENSGTQTKNPTTQPETPQPEKLSVESVVPASTSTTGLNTVNKIPFSIYSESAPISKNDVVNFIKKHGSKPKSNKTYGKVNKALQKKYSKVLSSDKMKELASLLQVKNESGKIYSKLKSLKVPGFKRGGIVPVDDIEKQVKANGDKVLVSANPGEGLLTPVQTEMFQKFVNNGLPDLVSATNTLQPLITMPKMPEIEPVRNMENVINIDNITLPNVQNAEDFANELLPVFQKSKGFEKLVKSASGVTQLAGAGRLDKYRHRF